MLSFYYVILLLFLTIDNQNRFSIKIIDHLSFNNQNNINNLNINQSYYDKNFNETFLQIFTSNDKFTKNNDYQKEIMNLFDYKFEELIYQFNKNFHINQKFEFNNQLISLTFEKLSSNNISNKHLLQSNGVQIRFPELCINKSIIINLISIPSLSILSLTIHNQYGQIINIKNTTKPFEIYIPRKIKYEYLNLLSDNNIFKYYYINLTHNINLSISLHIEIESKNTNLSYLFLIRFNGIPNLKTNQFDQWKLICPKDRKMNTTKYVFFLDNTQILHHQSAILGIHEMKECNETNLNDNSQFSSNYSIRTYTSSCSYFDSNNNWQSDGLLIGSETNEYFTQCFSTHLTTFAGGFIVLPEPVRWNELDPSFTRNLTIYITLIVIGILFFIIMIYSYRKDKIDGQKLMVIPLNDNNKHDTYLYQLVVFTGMRANAGTQSKVSLILSGNDDETNMRTLTADRRILDRGSIDSFIMAVPKPLGQLNYLRIWHDNSGLGSSASWFLKYILVRDLQTMETNYFICEKWLAVEKDSGEIDRTLTVASELEKNELKNILTKNAYRSMADNHLWFSIFAYHVPSANRFTRIQRCTCCFAVLFISLLMNIFYYGIKQDIQSNEFNQYGLTIGPFIISKEEISIGISVELIIFFPSLLLVALFRRSKPHRSQVISPVSEAIENIQKNRTKKLNNSSLQESKEKKFLLPWWCLILAYILSFLMIITSIFFIIIRSVQYGDVRTRQWLGSILSGFCASVLLTQPLKVFSLALLFMCFCRKKSQAEAFIEHEDPIEDFTISTEDAHRKFPPKSILAKTRLDPYRTKRDKYTLKKLREIRLKEINTWSILRELIFLLLFLSILYAISFANRDIENAHQMVKYLRREFLIIDSNTEYKYKTKENYIYENINSIKDYWYWLENIFVDKYRNMRWNDLHSNKSYLAQYNRTNRIIGWPILRQLRVKNDSCPRKALYGQMEIDDCSLPYTWYNEDTNPFGFNIPANSDKYNAFKYQSASDKTLIYSTSHATYMAGGYIHEIKQMPTKKILEEFQNLQNHHWIDRYTRAVFLTFGLYNPNSNLFVYCSLLLEQLPKLNNVIFRPSFHPFKLVQLYTGTELIYCLIYLILIIYYMYVEIKLFLQLRKTYIKQFWSYINWAIIICSWFGVVIHIFRQTEVNKMGDLLKKTQGSQPINLQFFSYLDSVLTYLLGFCCFFGTIKILRLLRFNRRLSLLQLTLQKSARQILGFLIMFSIVFIAFTSLFYLLYYSDFEKYSTFSGTSLTCFQMISIHFSSIKELKMIDPILSGLCLFLFLFLAVFLLSNMFISIIVDNFNKIRHEQLKQANEIELIEFIMDKMKRWIGLRTTKRQIEKNKNLITEFPQKVDKLIIALDKINQDTKHE